MAPVTAVLLIGGVAFLFGAAAPVVFGPSEEQREPARMVDWLVRGLVGAAVAHTALAIYDLEQQARHADDFGNVLISDTMMNLFALGGILLALAALLHLLSARTRA